MTSALGVLIPPLRFSVVAAVGPSQQAPAPDTGAGSSAPAPQNQQLRKQGDKAARRRQAQQAQTIYRGTYPKPRNLPFLSRLYLRTILSLTPKPPAEIGFGGLSIPPSLGARLGAAATAGGGGGGGGGAHGTTISPDGMLKAWADAEGIRLVHIHVPSAKDRSPSALPAEDAQRILSVMTDPANLPLYIHCLDGVEVTALCIALLRKTQRWHPRAILDEYCRHLRDPTPTAPVEISTYIDQFEVGPGLQDEGDEEDEEEEDEEDEEEEEDEDEEGSDDALEALDLEGY